MNIAASSGGGNSYLYASNFGSVVIVLPAHWLLENIWQSGKGSVRGKVWALVSAKVAVNMIVDIIARRNNRREEVRGEG